MRSSSSAFADSMARSMSGSPSGVNMTRISSSEKPAACPSAMSARATVAAPWFVMQPAMDAGLLALKTPAPLKNCLRNLVNHAVFGAGLYGAAAAVAGFAA